MYECRIAEKLVELRTKKGITQNELAKSLSVSNKTVSKWENGMSAPSLNMLIAISDYYNISTDELLGRYDNNNSTSPIPTYFSDIKRQERISKIFSYLREITPENMVSIVKLPEDNKYDFIPHDDKFHDNIVMVNDFVNVYTNSEDLNMSFVLLRNRSNFAWLKDEEKQEKIAEIFELLSDKDAISACHFLHSTACSDSFTADYIAKNVGISVEKATEILNKLWKLKTCRKRRVHLYEGERVIFEFSGDGFLLGILALAYLKTDDKRDYDSRAYRGAKMIDG